MSGRNIWIAASMVCLSLLWSSEQAGAQVRVNNGGHALDANNRVDSGGLNDGSTNNVNPAITGANNAIINGTSPGLSYFHFSDVRAQNGRTAQVVNADPSSFHGILAGNAMDQLNRAAAGTPYGINSVSGMPQYQPVVGSATGVNPPAGYVPQGYSGAYVPAPPGQPFQSTNQLNPNINTFNVPLPSPDQAVLPGMVNMQADQSFVTTSPLYGVQEWRLGDDGTYHSIDMISGQPTGTMNQSSPNPGLNAILPPSNSNLSTDQIQQMRQELNAPLQGAGNESANPNGTGAVPGATPQPGATPKPDTRLTPLQQSDQYSITQKPLASALPLTSLTGTSANTGQSQRNQFVAPPPGLQSAQYAQLQARLKAYEQSQPSGPQSDEEANRQFREEARLRQQAIAKNGAIRTPLPSSTGVNGGPATRPATVIPPPSTAQPDQPIQPPVRMNSLAAGVQARGLNQLLSSAEDLLQKHLYASAIEQYDNAAAVAPNNPLIILGRANAELGASLYARSETDLRSAFSGDAALMMGQYDLNVLLGADRVATIVNDLKSIATAAPQNPTPVFLLGYVAYNTGQEQQAANWMRMAEQRGGGTDPLIDSLLAHWNLSKAPATRPADLNK